MKRSLPKKALCVALIVAFVGAMSSGVCFAQKKPIKLLIGHFEPPVGAYAMALTAFAKDLEERTNGRVKVTISLGGALGKPGEFFELVSAGVCDISSTVPAFHPGKFPMTEIIALPYTLTKGEIVSKVALEFYKKGYLDKELSAVKVLGISAGQGEKFFTPDKPITTIADVKGKKLFASSSTTQEKVRRLGGVPMAMPVTDLYSSLQKGIIDGFLGDWAFLSILRLYELTKYATIPSNGVMFVITVMNKKKFNSLPADIQAILVDLGESYSIKMGKYWDDSCELGKQGLLDRGGKIVTWKEGEMEKIEKAWAPIWTQWIEENEKKGLPARQAVDDMYNLLKNIAGLDPAAIGYRPQ